jgi:hypothetical protein
MRYRWADGDDVYIPARDEVLPIDSLPAREPGAPIPLVLADEFRTFVSYYARVTDQGDRSAWDVLPASDPQEEAVVLLEFSGCYAHLFAAERRGLLRSPLGIPRPPALPYR